VGEANGAREAILMAGPPKHFDIARRWVLSVGTALERLLHTLLTEHLPIGPVLEIADRELFEEWIGVDELFTRGPAGRVGTRHA
jgi:hypothetical protein